MAIETIGFWTIIIMYIAGASALTHSKTLSQLGFLMFMALYPLFAAAIFFVPVRTVALGWLTMALVNIPIQIVNLRRHGITRLPINVMTTTVFLWPIQMAAMALGNRTHKEIKSEPVDHKAVLGELPATITGTISFTYHIGTDDGVDMVWLKEFGDLEIFMSPDLFDRIGAEENKSVTLTVDERDGTAVGKSEKILWVINADEWQDNHESDRNESAGTLVRK